ncbi:hypothetical protein RRG08_018709 [Elysia crispata]|uniref:Uncharacterized protein n=1 Tax=Elysia crispata TaxID=231223 RepID=A0AAE0YHD3_9GAST|nr:hypothetical protein RRG08_018709 [Elysia crispata]
MRFSQSGILSRFQAVRACSCRNQHLYMHVYTRVNCSSCSAGPVKLTLYEWLQGIGGYCQSLVRVGPETVQTRAYGHVTKTSHVTSLPDALTC